MASNESEYAKVGDTITIIAKHNHWYGKKFKVVQRPEDSHVVESPGDVWVFDNLLQVERCLYASCYEVFSRVVSKNVCDDVDSSLKKQLDKNLGHAFRFWIS